MLLFKGTFILIFFALLQLTQVINCFGQDQSEVVAQKGEGIYSLLRKNGLDPSTYLKDFIELNKEKLGAQHILLEGQTYLLPQNTASVRKIAETAKPNIEIHPIFGKKFEKVEISSQELAGSIFYLMAGHGGYDPGAIGDYGPYQLSEDEYAYDVTLRLARNLVSKGAEVHLIIQDENDGIRDDTILPMDKDEVALTKEKLPYSQKARLRQRTQIVNDLYAKKRTQSTYHRLISIHLDSRNTGENTDVFFYHHHRSKSGEKLANSIHQTFARKYQEHQPGRQYSGSVSSRSSLYVIRNTHPPIVFIELGNIQNSRDQRRFVMKNNRQAVANWIAEGILADYRQQ